MWERLHPVAEEPPFAQGVTSSLTVNRLQLPVIRRNTRLLIPSFRQIGLKHVHVLRSVLKPLHREIEELADDARLRDDAEMRGNVFVL